MADHLLYIPGESDSPENVGKIPAVGAILDELRSHFDVEIFRWPTIRGAPHVPPTWQACAEVLRQALVATHHIVAMWGNVALCLLALKDRSLPVRSFVCDGMSVPPATLKALSMDELLPGAQAAHQIDALWQGHRWVMEGASEDQLAHRQSLRAADPAYVHEFLDSWAQLNLLDENPQVDIPCLYVEIPIGYPGWSGMFEVFRRFVPRAEYTELPAWRMHHPEHGKAFAARALPFLQSHKARTVLTTVLFADIVDSTVHARTLGDRDWTQLLGRFHSQVGRELTKAGGKLVDTAGDGFLAVFDDPASAVACATAINQGVGELGLEARAGVHAGQVEVVGEKYTGVTVHTAARVAAKAQAGEVLVSDTVRQLLVGSSLQFEDRGRHELKGLPQPVALYAASAS
jgi:class 3 adenylate cyclase